MEWYLGIIRVIQRWIDHPWELRLNVIVSYSYNWVMDVVVVHPSLNRCGGAERVCLAVVEALMECGYRVILATVDRTDWFMLEDRFGSVIRPSGEFYLYEHTSTQDILLASCFISELMYLKGCDALIFNTYGDLLDSIADVCYVNALPPYIAYRYDGYGDMGSTCWRVASIVHEALSKIARSFGRSIVIANSRFMQSILWMGLGVKSTIVYPPVDVEMFRSAGGDRREDIVVTATRLRFGKRLEIIPWIAREVGEARFKILGVADKLSEPVIERLRDIIDGLGVGDRVELLVNQPYRRLVEEFSSAKIYLQTQPTESFGISIVEAMAAGCIPLVPRCGGPWIDILGMRDGLYGLSYVDVSEAKEKIRCILRDEGVRTGMLNNIRRRVDMFSKIVFKRKIAKIVDTLYRYRCRR